MAKYLIGTDIVDCDGDGLVKELIALLGYAADRWDLINDPGVSVEFVKIDSELDDSGVEALILAHGMMSACVARRCEERCKEVDHLLSNKYNALFAYGGTTWQIDLKSQIMIGLRESFANNCILSTQITTVPGILWEGFYRYFRDADNNDVLFENETDFLLFAKAVSDHCTGLFPEATSRKDALRGMVDPTMEDINNYDITGGW